MPTSLMTNHIDPSTGDPYRRLNNSPRYFPHRRIEDKLLVFGDIFPVVVVMKKQRRVRVSFPHVRLVDSIIFYSSSQEINPSPTEDTSQTNSPIFLESADFPVCYGIRRQAFHLFRLVNLKQ